LTFIIAEIGVNWNGDYELAKTMIKNAKSSGCNAVKFQAFKEELIKNHPEKKRLMKASISEENIQIIDELAKSIKIEWFCTPMYPEAVELLVPYVNRFKVRELDGRELLENKTSKLFENLLKTNKEIIVSSQKSPKGTNYYNYPKIKWLYCVPKYPCDLKDLDFSRLEDFDGYSNHCPLIIAPLTAVKRGAKLLEIHITVDKSKNFVDNNVSFDFQELKKLVGKIRMIEEKNSN